MKENDCGKCPYYRWDKDYYGECDEYCLIHCDLLSPCKKPMITRRLIRLKLSIIDFLYEWIMKIEYKKGLKDSE